MTLSQTAQKRREKWLNTIINISGKFGQDSNRIINELENEVKLEGLTALLDHFHLCGSIPENFHHDSSEEKLYSKYTDALLFTAFKYMGLQSCVYTERGAVADVEVITKHYSFVADAKVFRLSRTAKNQKDFKVSSMNDWKYGKEHAMVVCPIFQLPSRTSQIYFQAIAHRVLIFTYSHMCVLLRYFQLSGEESAIALLSKIFRASEILNPTKDGFQYWTSINRTMLEFDSIIRNIWLDEKHTTLDVIKSAKYEALSMISKERESILQMSRQEAIDKLIHVQNIDGRIKVINSIKDNKILEIT